MLVTLDIAQDRWTKITKHKFRTYYGQGTVLIKHDKDIFNKENQVRMHVNTPFMKQVKPENNEQVFGKLIMSRPQMLLYYLCDNCVRVKALLTVCTASGLVATGKQSLNTKPYARCNVVFQSGLEQGCKKWCLPNILLMPTTVDGAKVQAAFYSFGKFK